ncbi:MAG TPA: PPC domain-containing DNA-binding protein [Chitinophagaceae bacterium]
MKSKLINNDNMKTFAVVFDDGEEVIQTLQDFARQNNLRASQFTGIGAFSEVTLGFFDFTKKDYLRTEITEQVELLSLLGDITLNKEKHQIHPHVVVGKRDGTAHGGHLLRAIVHPTLELIINESPGYLQRELNKETGLPLIKI